MRVIRLDRQGRDVTNLTGLWGIDDCEIAITQFPHPGITTGQHTNGPASIWIRLIDKDMDWVRCYQRSEAKVVRDWVEYGMDAFLEGDCRDKV